MPVAFTLAGLAVVLAVALLAVGRLGGLPEAEPDRAPLELPTGRPVTGSDVDGLRFAVGLRGYRMDEVDEVLDRVSDDIAGRDATIDALRRRLALAGIDPDEVGLSQLAAPDPPLPSSVPAAPPPPQAAPTSPPPPWPPG